MSLIDVTKSIWTPHLKAYGDGLHDDTAAIQAAIDRIKKLGGGVVHLPVGHYRVSGLTIDSAVEIRGEGWNTIIDHRNNGEHAITVTGDGTTATQGVVLRDFKLIYGGSGGFVHGIYMLNVCNFFELRRLYIGGFTGEGVYIKSSENSNEGALYSTIVQCQVEGNNDGVALEGSCNNISIFGGRFGSNVGYGLFVDDSTTPNPNSFPNTLRVYGTDLPGNQVGLYENGHSNAYYGLRFESNSTADIQIGSKSNSAQFFGQAYGTGSGVILGTAVSRPTSYDKSKGIRQWEDNGYFEYWDELAGAVRKAPKRSVASIQCVATTAGSGTKDTPGFRIQDRAKIKRVSLIPASTITGANTNYCKLQLRRNRSGTDVAIAEIAFVSGTNASALVDTVIPILSNDAVQDGDVIYVEKQEQGGGMNMPLLIVQIEHGGY